MVYLANRYTQGDSGFGVKHYRHANGVEAVSVIKDVTLNKQHMESGYSLLELMVSIGIAGALAAVAIPSLSSWVQNSRIDAATETLSAGIMLARSEAVARNQNTLLSSPVNGSFHICVVTLADSVCDPTMPNDYIGSLQLPDSTITLDHDTAASDGLRFNPRGRLDEASRFARYTLCDARGVDDGISIDINSVGRVTVKNLDSEAGDTCSIE